MAYVLVFLMLAAMLAVYAVTLGHWGWLLAWPVVSFLAVSAAYFQGSPAMFGKRADGRRGLFALLLLLPYLLWVLVLWHGLRVFSRESPYDRLTEHLWIGRLLLVRDLPEEVGLVLDVTCEFSRPRGWAQPVRYLAWPILDAAAPPPGELVELAERIREADELVYLHCAQGHGRTGLVAAVYLLSTGRAANAQEALEQVQAARPGVRLNPRQQQALEQAAALLAAA